MSKIIGVTVGTPLSVDKIREKIKPVTSVNGVKADETGNVEVHGGASAEEIQSAVEAALQEAKESGVFDGVSPTVKVSVISGGHRVTITDASGSKTFDVMNGKDGSGGGGTGGGADGVTFYPSIDSEGNLTWTNDGGLTNPDPVNIKGQDGKDGYTPVKGVDYFDGGDGQDGVTPHIGANGNWYIANTDTGVQATGSDGKDGQSGSPGADGVSPTVSVSTITGGHRITITDKNGTKTVDVMDGGDGSPGTPGQPGEDGKTPVKGTDYWTAADKQEIIDDLKDEGISGATAKTATLTASGWATGADGRYAQTISVSGVTTDESQVIVVDVHLTGTDTAADNEALAAWGPDDGSGPSSNNIKQGNGTLTFYCTAIPSINIPLIVGVH